MRSYIHINATSPRSLKSKVLMFSLVALGANLWSLTESQANIPAAYLACEGALDGEACALPGPQYGVCLRDTLCQDPEETQVNECLLCVDACWGRVDNEPCIRPWTGTDGICEAQDRCTDKEETSFQECMRCVMDNTQLDDSSLRYSMDGVEGGTGDTMSTHPHEVNCDQGGRLRRSPMMLIGLSMTVIGLLLNRVTSARAEID